MLSIGHKRYILIIVDLAFSTYIWYVNWSWGNFFTTCLILSTTTFFIIYTPFEIYWSIRDLWFDRWTIPKIQDLEFTRINLPVDDGNLIGELIKSKSHSMGKSQQTLIIINHGFSDTKDKLKYLYYPLALQGYIILVYDARGTGESKNTGKRTQFDKRINDFNCILKWIMKNDNLNKLEICSIGVSIGAIPTLISGFPNEKIKKIVAISSISNYKKNIKNLNPIVKFSYHFKGVELNPSERFNKTISPALVLRNLKDKVSAEKWTNLAKRTFLIHAKNDQITKFSNFEENLAILELPPSNQLLLEKGGHNQKKNELILVASILKFFL